MKRAQFMEKKTWKWGKKNTLMIKNIRKASNNHKQTMVFPLY